MQNLFITLPYLTFITHFNCVVHGIKQAKHEKYWKTRSSK